MAKYEWINRDYFTLPNKIVCSKCKSTVDVPRDKDEEMACILDFIAIHKNCDTIKKYGDFFINRKADTSLM